PGGHPQPAFHRGCQHTPVLPPPCNPHRQRHPFPTRRSSDLHAENAFLGTDKSPAAGTRSPRQTAGARKVPISDRHLPRACRLTRDRKSTRLNSSHSQISYAVFCLKKKNDDSPFWWCR